MAATGLGLLTSAVGAVASALASVAVVLPVLGIGGQHLQSVQ
jgi:hypothetical protein